MVRIITGQWTKDGCQVRFVAGLSKKEALKVADNIFLSANIFGNSNDNRQTIAFTIPILYLGENYQFGRIYFKFSSLNEEDENQLNFSPDFLFCSYPELTSTKSLTILKIDTLTWQFLKLNTEIQETFNKFCNNVIDIIKHRKPIL